MTLLSFLRRSDSAIIFAGGLPFNLTEGDVITLFSQYVASPRLALVLLPPSPRSPFLTRTTLIRYGEIGNINMPRDKDTGKPRGFAFLTYLDQRSTVLAVDNLNGAKVLGRTLRVDHTRNYEQPKGRDENGEVVEPEEESMNALPVAVGGPAGGAIGATGTGAGEDDDADLEDPMAAYIKQERVSPVSTFLLDVPLRLGPQGGQEG